MGWERSVYGEAKYVGRVGSGWLFSWFGRVSDFWTQKLARSAEKKKNGGWSSFFGSGERRGGLEASYSISRRFRNANPLRFLGGRIASYGRERWLPLRMGVGVEKRRAREKGGGRRVLRVVKKDQKKLGSRPRIGGGVWIQCEKLGGKKASRRKKALHKP